MSMSYVQITSSCLSAVLGTHGLDSGQFETTLKKTEPALQILRAQYADGSLPLLRLAERTDDIDALVPVASRYRELFDDVVILGTGGSSLGGQTLCRLSESEFGPRDGAPRLHFFDNVDPHSMSTMLDQLALDRTGFLVISKSGSTAETMTQFLVSLKAVQNTVGPDKAADHFTAITEPGENLLRRIAKSHGMAVLDHDPNIGGRYSALSLVGLLPAMISGLDVGAVRAGAMGVLQPVLDGEKAENIEAAVGASISVGLASENNILSTVMMPYVDRLADFSLWFRQLWAESLGKDSKGTTPVNALGIVDQHSQLQLYLDGPRDKMFTIIMLSCAGEGPSVDPALAEDDDLAYLSGKSVGALMDAEQRATAETLIRNNRTTRIIQIDTLDETVMGALMMHFMLETIIAAHLFGVDPFDQPAVEEGKILTRKYLAGEGGR